MPLAPPGRRLSGSATARWICGRRADSRWQTGASCRPALSHFGAPPAAPGIGGHAGGFAARVWPDKTFVDFEHGLNAAVKRLRAMLGDSATTPRFIETLPAGATGSSATWPSRLNVRPRWAYSTSASRESRPRGLGRRDSGVGPPRCRVVPAASALGSNANLIRLTSTSGLNADPALSPDGRLLAYASDRGGNGGFDIWVQRVGAASHCSSPASRPMKPSRRSLRTAPRSSSLAATRDSTCLAPSAAPRA